MTQFTDLLLPHIRGLKTYDGVDPMEVMAEQAGIPRDQVIRLNGNENPYGPSPRVVEALGQFQFYNHYPDPDQRQLREVLSDYLVAQGYRESDLENALEMGSTESIKGAVQAGMGISVVSSAAIEKELQLGILCSIPLDPPLERSFSFVRQRQKFRTRLMEKLYQFAREYCQTHDSNDAHV